MPGSVAGLSFFWHQWLGNHTLNIWNLIPVCLMWIVRLERTCCSFEDTEKMLEELNFFAGVVFLIGLVVGVFTDYSSLSELWFLRITSWFFFRFLLVIIMNLYFSLLFSLIIFLWLPIKKKKKKTLGVQRISHWFHYLSWCLALGFEPHQPPSAIYPAKTTNYALHKGLLTQLIQDL